MEFVAEEILREILLRLPARDVIRSGCVCRLWRGIVIDPSFQVLHSNSGHAAVSGTDAETLLVPEFRAPDWGMGFEMTVLTVSSAKPICRFTELAACYKPVNACAGFLLIASHVKDWPLYVCNPVTGEKLKIPAPPKINHILWRIYAMGYSPSTREYKLFRLSFENQGWPETEATHLDVYTLGSSDDWRRRPCRFPYCDNYGLHSTPPVLIDGKLYVLMGRRQTADRILVIDVASEAQCTYRLPEDFTGDRLLDDFTRDGDGDGDVVATTVHAFELRGQLCVALRFDGWPRLCFWVMPSLRGRRLSDDKNHTWLPGWERRYTFYVDINRDNGNQPCGAWLNKNMLCYRLGDLVYKFNTTKPRQKQKHILEWDYQNQVHASSRDLQWNVYGGYRPSFVSPYLAFASAPLLLQHRYEQEDCEQALVHTAMCCDKRCSTCTPDLSNHPIRPAKRYRKRK